MKLTRFVCSTALSVSLLAGTAFAGYTSPCPEPPPPTPTVKQAHVKKAGATTARLSLFDLLPMLLSNLGIL